MNEEIKSILNRWGADTVVAMQAILTAQRNVATGNLRNSIKYKLGADFIEFTMSEYGKIVDEGRSPGWYAPIAPLKKWATAKGLPVAAAYTARAAIKKRGLRPKRFFTTVIEQEIAELVPLLETSIVQFFGDRIKIINDQP